MSRVPRLAVVLAAGRGRRLGPLTDSVPKPLARVGCVPVLHRLLNALDRAGVERVVLVVGYRGAQIVSSVGPSWRGMDVTYVVNPDWETANNIVSLLRAAGEIREDFLLLEADLLLPEEGIRRMVGGDRIAVDVVRPGQEGTTVEADSRGLVVSMHVSSARGPHAATNLLKTVNLYSIRRSTFADRLLPRLESLVRMGCTDEYYERAIAGAIADRDAHFHTVPFSDLPWLEIDTLRDLARAESMLAPAARLRRVRCSG